MACLKCNKNRCSCATSEDRTVYKTYTIPVPGESAYEAWRRQPGNEGKTEAQFLEEQKANLVWTTFNI